MCPQAPIHTLCVGHAQSMAAILLAAGEKGHRHALPHSHMMIHEPSLGSTGGKISHIAIRTEQLQKQSLLSAALIAKHTGKVRAAASASRLRWARLRMAHVDRRRSHFLTLLVRRPLAR